MRRWIDRGATWLGWAGAAAYLVASLGAALTASVALSVALALLGAGCASCSWRAGRRSSACVKTKSMLGEKVEGADRSSVDYQSKVDWRAFGRGVRERRAGR